MKKSFLLFLPALMVFFSFLDTTAQIPMAIPYQAVARDASGNLLVNQAVGIRFSILSDSPSLSTVHYQETHSATTTDLGQINLNIGSGTVSSGTFSAIPWANSNMRLQVEMDPSGGTNYTVTGVTVFGAVPYAFRSGSSELSGNGVPNGTAAGQTLRWNGTAWEASSLLLNNGNNISINPGAAAPDLMLTIGDNVSKDGGIVAMGQAGLGPTLTTTGSGSRMIWYPKKSAFRVGYANGNSWDDSQIGGYSFASGFGSIVTGEFSFSAGSSNTVSGWYSAAFGSSNQVGNSGPSSGWSSAAFGSGNQVAGNYSFAVGQQNVVSTSWATAFGSNNTASAYYSLVGGQNNTASGEAAVALGRSNQASGLYSFTAGNESAARGNRSMAFGQGAIARSWSEIALGSFNTDYTPADSNSFNSNDRIFVIGNGNYSARKNALVILKNGNLGLGENNPNDLFVVGSGGKFRVDTLGNIKRINNISYSWPASQGSANQFLKNDGSGNLSWANPSISASDITTGTLDDARLSANIFRLNAVHAAGSMLYSAGASGWVIRPPGTDGQVLKMVAGIPTWGTDNTSTSGGTITSISTGFGLTGGPITSTGTIAVDNTVIPRLNGVNTFTGSQTITPSSITGTGLVIQGLAGQSANLTEWKNSGSTILASVSSTGVFTGNGSGLTDLSIPASGITGTLSSSSLPSSIAYKNSSNTFTQGQVITPAPTETALTISSAPGQTAPLTLWFDDSGSGVPIAQMSNNGALSTRGINAPYGNFVGDPSGATTPLRLWAAASQFNPLTEWRSSTGDVLASVSNTGVFTGNGSGLTDLSVPASGITGTLSTSSLPSTIAYINSSNTFTQGQVINALPTQTALTIISSATGPTDPITMWFDNSGSGIPLATMQNNGTLFTRGVMSDFGSFTSNTGASVPLRIQAAASQFDPLTEWKSSAGTVLASVNFEGVFTGNGSGLTDLSVPASGITGTLSSSSLPSTVALKNSINTFTQGQVISPSSNQTTLTINSTPGQTFPLTAWFDNTGSGVPIAYMSKEGVLSALGLEAKYGNFVADPAGGGISTPMRIWAAPSQSDPLTEWRNATGTVLASVSSTGVFTGNGSGLTNLSVPASGITGTLSSSSLPSTVALKNSINTFTQGQVISPSSNQTTLTINSTPGQTFPLTAWFDNTGSGVPIAFMSKEGVLSALGLEAKYGNFVADPAGGGISTPMRIWAAPSQSDPLTEWRNSTGTVLASVSSTGVFTGNGSGLTNVSASSNSVVGGDISGTIGNAQLVAGSVGSSEILNASVTSSDIADLTISSADLADGSVTSVKVADLTISSADLADGSVTSAKVLDGTIATADLADGSVTGAKVLDGTIATADLANTSVTNAKLADNSVSGAKLAMGSDALGDMLVYNGTDYVRLAAGANGQILKMSGGTPTWSNPTGLISNVLVSSSGAVAPSSTQAFISPTVSVTITSGQRVLLDVTCGLGAGASAASSLTIYPGYKLSTATTVVPSGGGIINLTCPANTRLTYTVTGQITGLTAGTYQFGMVGNTSSPNWTNNDFCYTRAVVVE